LVEMLVAFGLISLTLVVVAGTFLSTGQSSRVTQRQIELTDSIAFVLADVTREARVGENFGDGAGAELTLTRIAGINNQAADVVRYFIGTGSSANRLMKEVNGVDDLPITPPNTQVNSFEVDVDDTGLLVRLYIEAEHVDAELGETPVRVQTSVAAGRTGI